MRRWDAESELPLIRIPASATTLEGFHSWALSKDQPKATRISYIRKKIFIESLDADIGFWVSASALTFPGFCTWSRSKDFPERGRIDYVDGEIFIDMSPEELETHNKVKMTVSSLVWEMAENHDLGEFFGDCVSLRNPATGLKTEPDGTFITWQSYETGKVRLLPRKNFRGQYLEIQGSRDWVLEVVSRTSYKKDTEILRGAYHRAGIAEYWLIDTLGSDILFQILVRRPQGCVPVAARQGWYRSPVFDRSFRLERKQNRQGRWRDKLHMKST
jgi:Uma2 family endonuclease